MKTDAGKFETYFIDKKTGTSRKVIWWWTSLVESLNLRQRLTKSVNLLFVEFDIFQGSCSKQFQTFLNEGVRENLFSLVYATWL